ncbi:MAG TPA: hypothetical protein VK365_07975 [Nocardioidaceae bacterium]|jgi:hypothetical protein|nr:hypothetical protein [Nocardioidaceae bacterium]
MSANEPDSTAAAVYLHIGLPKSGTSYLQSTLWDSRQQLAEHGVLVPGPRHMSQNLAAWDLMGRRPRGAERPQVVGAWEALVGEVRAWTGSHSVVSEEFLAFARPRQVRQAVRAFAPAPVHVVVTVRDLARVLVGAWQQELAKGRSWTWAEYAAAVREPEQGPASAGVAFWLRQDVVRVLDVWEREVPRGRVHVVTVPPPGSPPEVLAQRFAAATRLDPDWLAAGDQRGNVSVGAAEAEVLRRLNTLLGDRLNERQYTRVVSNGVRPALQDRGRGTMGLPEGERGWVTERASAAVDELRRRRYDVVGDLQDLIPARSDDSASRPDTARPDEVAEAALTALGTVVQEYADLWWRARNKAAAAPTHAGSPVASTARSVAARARLAALSVMDRSRLARRLAIRYLDRSSRT